MAGELFRGAANPILRNGPEQLDDTKAGPAVVVRIGAGDYRMFYEAIDSSLDPDGGVTSNLYNAIALATSTDGTDWTKQGRVFTPLALGTWENSEVAPNAVVWNPDTSLWHMYYHGGNNSPSNGRRIGLATSPNLTDGGTWTRYGDTPIITPSGGDLWVADSRVIRVDSGDWRAWAVARDGSDVGHIVLYTSTDGLSWTRSGSVLTKGTGGQWDDVEITAFSIVLDGATFRAWYVGRNASNSGLIGYATSPDGATWTKGAQNPVLSDATDDDITDSVEAYIDGDQVRVVYGQYDLVGQTLRGKGEAFETLDARGFGGTVADRILLPSENSFDFAITDAFSIGAWVYPTVLASGALVGKQDPNNGYRGWNIALSGSSFAMDLRGGAGLANQKKTTSALTQNAWQQVGGTNDGTGTIAGLKLYRNGARATETTTDSNFGAGSLPNDVPAYIGARGDGVGAPLFPFAGGRIAYVAIWNVALSDAEWAQFYAGGEIPQKDNLVAFYRMDDPADPGADEANGLDGTVVGTTSAVGAPVAYDPLVAEEPGTDPGLSTGSGAAGQPGPWYGTRDERDKKKKRFIYKPRGRI